MITWLFVLGISAYLTKDYLFCYNIFLVILGGLIGFFCTLFLHDNKYVAILAHVISSKLSSLTDASSAYDNDNMLLNITLNTMWFNVGYWKNVEINPHSAQNSFVRACEDMTSLLTSSVGLTDGETVLDVGCGNGEQDIYIWERHKKSKIVAIELSPNQVKYARTKIASLGISDRIQFEAGNAVDLASVLTKEEVRKYLGFEHPTFESTTFDVVLALDCAYHFQFRTDFLQQAYKVMKKGGRIGLADICLADDVDFGHLNPIYRFGLKWLLRRMSIPPENLTDIQTYKQKLEKCGFGTVTVTPITEHVFPGLLRFTEEADSRFGCVVKPYRLNKLRGVTSFLRKIISRRLLEYVIVSGTK